MLHSCFCNAQKGKELKAKALLVSLAVLVIIVGFVNFSYGKTGSKTVMVRLPSSEAELKSELKLLEPFIDKYALWISQLKLYEPFFTQKYKISDVIQRIEDVPYDPEKGFKFVVIGDPKGNQVVFGQLARKIREEKPLFVICVGDIVPHGSAEEYAKFLGLLSQETDYNFLPVIGNHDIGHNKIEYQYILGPLDYCFDYANCRFVILDNARGSLTKEQLDWLDERLGEVPEYRKFVFMHMPPDIIKKWAWHSFHQGADEFVKIVSKHKVNEVFMGNIHAYSTEEVDGVLYIVTGGAGAKLHKKYGPAGNVHHYVVVNVNKDKVLPEVVRETQLYVKSSEKNPIYTGLIRPTKIENRELLIEKKGSDWSYAKESPQISASKDWLAAEYDDTSWQVGQTPFGYGQKGVATLLDEGCNYYFRKLLEIKETAGCTSYILRVASNDAALVYINGNLVDKDPAWDIPDGHQSGYWNREVKLEPRIFQQGENVIAVVLRNRPGSSNAYFDLKLLGVLKAGE